MGDRVTIRWSWSNPSNEDLLHWSPSYWAGEQGHYTQSFDNRGCCSAKMLCHASRNKPHFVKLGAWFFRTPYSDANIVYADTHFQGEKTLKNVFLTEVGNYEIRHCNSLCWKVCFLHCNHEFQKNIFYLLKFPWFSRNNYWFCILLFPFRHSNPGVTTLFPAHLYFLLGLWQ